MAEQDDDARVQEIRARYGGLEKLLEDTTGQWDRSQLLHMVSELAGAAKTIPYLLERLDALTSERDELLVASRECRESMSRATTAMSRDAVTINDLKARLAAAEAALEDMRQTWAKLDDIDVFIDPERASEWHAARNRMDYLVSAHARGCRPARRGEVRDVE